MLLSVILPMSNILFLSFYLCTKQKRIYVLGCEESIRRGPGIRAPHLHQADLVLLQESVRPVQETGTEYSPRIIIYNSISKKKVSLPV